MASLEDRVGSIDEITAVGKDALPLKDIIAPEEDKLWLEELISLEETIGSLEETAGSLETEALPEADWPGVALISADDKVSLGDRLALAGTVLLEKGVVLGTTEG